MAKMQGTSINSRFYNVSQVVGKHSFYLPSYNFHWVLWISKFFCISPLIKLFNTWRVLIHSVEMIKNILPIK